MSEKRQNILIGSVVAIAICVAMGFVLFIKPRVGDGRKHLRVWFVNIDKINVGTPVTLAGKPIGGVAEIKTITEAREQKVDALGKVYYYELKLKIDSGAQIYSTDAIFMQTSGLLGERNIAIIPKHIPNLQKAQLADERTPLYAQSSNSVEEAVAEVAQTVATAQVAVQSFSQLLIDNRANATEALQGMAKVMLTANNLIQKLEEKNFAAQITQSLQAFTTLANQTATLATPEVVQNIQSLLHHTNSVLAALDDPARWTKLLQGSESILAKSRDILTQWEGHGDEVKAILSNTKAGTGKLQIAGEQAVGIASKWSLLTDNVAAGKGSLGMLLSNVDLYTNANLLLGKANTLVNDINQYGLLFQNNRNWRRARADRVANASEFKDAKAFKTYCDGEMDALQAGLARIEMLWKNVQEGQTSQNRSDFLKEFVQVVRRLNLLQQQLDVLREEMGDK